MTICTDSMSSVDHNLVTEWHTTYLLASSGITEGSYNQVILLRHHHEFHTLLPVTKTVELEILTDEVCWSILICRLTSCLINRCLLSSSSLLLGSTSLHDVGVHLCWDRHHQHGESHCQNRSFHYHGFINCTISSAKIKKIFDTCAKMTWQKTIFCKKKRFGTCFAMFFADKCPNFVEY